MSCSQLQHLTQKNILKLGKPLALQDFKTYQLKQATLQGAAPEGSDTLSLVVKYQDDTFLSNKKYNFPSSLLGYADYSATE